jgi:hypothetical protein
VDKVNRKSAPRRAVVRIEREGAWGRVEYAHLLDCGHTERRKRASRSEFLSCAWCVVAEQTDKEMKQIAVSAKSSSQVDDDLIDQFGSQLAMTEKLVAQVRAEVASHFSVPVESVDIVIEDDDGEMRMSFALIFLPSSDLMKFFKKIDQSPSPQDDGVV